MRRSPRKIKKPKTDDKTSVLLVGGPYDKVMIKLTKTPDTVDVGNDVLGRHKYGKVTDPDTGEYLGAYAWIDPELKQ